MIDSHSESSLVIYACRLCGHIESAKCGPDSNRPDQCPDCRIDSAFVPIDVVSQTEEMASSD